MATVYYTVIIDC